MNLLEKRMQSYDELVQAARGDVPVDLVIEGGRILNVLTGEILTGDIAVHKGFIVSLFTKTKQAKQRVDARGKIAIPAFIDPHVHIESSMVLPPGYAEIVAASGTGTVLADPHEIVNVMGVEGFAMMMDNSEDLPMRLFFDIPTCVPSKREAESSGADIQSDEVREMARLGGRKLGELMSYEEIIAGDPAMTGIVKTGWELGLPRDAHFPMFSVLGGVFSNLSIPQKLGLVVGLLGSQLLRWPALNTIPYSIFLRELRKHEYPELNAYLVALGLTADHETYGPEIQIKLDHGMHLMISSHIFLTLPQMMPIYLQGIRRLKYKDMIGLCTDDIWPDDLIEMGGIAGVLRNLVKNGIQPVDAVRFATVNNARRLAQAGIDEAALIGSLVPGNVADIVLVDAPLKNFKIDLVIHEGKVVAEKGKLTQAVPAPKVSKRALDSVPVAPVTADVFRIPSPSSNGSGKVRVRVLALPKPPGLPFPDLVEKDLPVNNGSIDSGEYIMIAVFNRYHKAVKSPVIGLIQGYTLKAGATASTLSHDSHNLIVLGTNPEDMALATNTVIQMKGGMAAVKDNRVLAKMSFPVGGLMSQEPVEVMAKQAKDFRQAIGALGLDPKSPILPFAIFSLPAGPGDKVTDLGIWDSKKQKLVDLLV
jgi:adenine deaminase